MRVSDVGKTPNPGAANAPSANNPMHGEALDVEWCAERELDRMIERRADREPDPDELEPTYAESVRRFNTRRRDANREAWANYHRDQAGRLRRNLEDLITHHETQAARLCESEATEGAA